MFKVDAHTHIIPKDLPKFKERFGYGGFVELQHTGCNCANMVRDDGKFFRAIEANCWDGAVRLKECEQHGVRVQVLSTIPVLFHYWAKPHDALHTAQFLNDHIAQVVAQAPNRFVGLATLPMQSPELAIKELERCMQLGFKGIEIGSHINEWNLDAPEIFAVFEACQDLGAAVFVHPWDMMGAERMPKYWLPWLVGMPAETSLAICSMIFGGVFERLPHLRTCFAHGGGSFPITVGRIEHGFHSRPDLCAVDNNVNPREYCGRFYVDSLVHDPKALRFVVDLMGRDRVMLGTDYPFPLGEQNPGELIAEVYKDRESSDLLLADNALRWLNLTRTSFLS